MQMMLLRYLNIISGIIFLAFLVAFGYEAFHYRLLADDHFFLQITSTYSFPKAVLFFYNGQNGRLFGHLICCAVYRIGAIWPSFYIFWQFILLFGFVSGIRALLLCFRDAKWITNRSKTEYTSIACLLVTAYYLLFVDTRIEVWHWIAATCIHTTSLILLIHAFVLLMRWRFVYSVWKLILLFAIFFLIAGLSESNAIGAVVLLVFVMFYSVRKHQKGSILILTSLIALVLGLCLNYFSPGAHQRLDWLPDFNFLQAVKNTVHSLVLIFSGWKYLFIRLIGLFIMILALFGLYTQEMEKSKPIFYGLIVLCFSALISIFSACFLLSDILPYRAASFSNLLWMIVTIVIILRWRLILRKSIGSNSQKLTVFYHF